MYHSFVNQINLGGNNQAKGLYLELKNCNSGHTNSGSNPNSVPLWNKSQRLLKAKKKGLHYKEF